MKYLPAMAIALGVGATVCVAIFVTNDARALWGLMAMFIACWAVPN